MLPFPKHMNKQIVSQHVKCKLRVRVAWPWRDHYGRHRARGIP